MKTNTTEKPPKNVKPPHTPKNPVSTPPAFTPFRKASARFAGLPRVEILDMKAVLK